MGASPRAPKRNRALAPRLLRYPARSLRNDAPLGREPTPPLHGSGPTTSRHAASRALAVVAIAISALFSQRSLGATRVVPDQYLSIQTAVDAAGNADTILVNPGVYREHIKTGAKALVLIGALGAGTTTIDGEGTAPVV